MDKNEWYQIGEDIKKQVQQAVDANDFSKLSKTIGETVGQAVGDMSRGINDVSRSINDVGKSINDAIQDARDGFQQGVGTPQPPQHQKWERYQGRVTYAKPNLRPDARLFKRNPSGSVSGVVWMVLGFGTMGFALRAFIYAMVGAVLGTGTVAAVTVPVVTAAAGLALGMYGAKIKGRTRRFQHYVEIVKERLYCSIEELAAKTGRSQRFVRKDLKRMMQKGMFLQAHLDKKEQCFIASDAVYQQYMLTQNQFEQKQRMEQEISQKPDNGETGGKKLDAEVQKVLEEGRDYVRMIRICNDEIPGEEMSEKLDKLELLVTRIFAQVEKEPELAPELQKMLSYYLPTTQKLLEAYRDLDKQNIDVKNISDTKREIETTVDTINNAFEKFLDELFRDKAWDIQSDISVLNTMLKQDGYLEKDFETK